MEENLLQLNYNKESKRERKIHTTTKQLKQTVQVVLGKIQAIFDAVIRCRWITHKMWKFYMQTVALYNSAILLRWWALRYAWGNGSSIIGFHSSRKLEIQRVNVKKKAAGMKKWQQKLL